MKQLPRDGCQKKSTDWPVPVRSQHDEICSLALDDFVHYRTRFAQLSERLHMLSWERFLRESRNRCSSKARASFATSGSVSGSLL